MKRTMTLSVNGTARRIEPDPVRSLLAVLRNELGLTGTKYGCGEGRCGACTVLLDGHPARSCRTPVGEVGEAKVRTIEGLGGKDGLHPVQQAFLRAGAMQCGYCTPGMIMACVGLLEVQPDPGEMDIRTALEGNVCRCGTYRRVLDAVRDAAGSMSGEGR